MPIGAKGKSRLVDTSVAVPLLVERPRAARVGIRRRWRPATRFEWARRLRNVLDSDQAAAPHSAHQRAVGRLIRQQLSRDPLSWSRGGGHALAAIPALGLAGGSLYDALVGATAVEHTGWCS